MTPIARRRGTLLAALVLTALAFSPVASPALAATVTDNQTTAGPRSCLDGGPPVVSPDLRVAVVKPVFTSTPYSQYAYASFYGFYKFFLTATGNFTTHLGWLSTNVSSGFGYNSGWGHTLPLYRFLTSAAAEKCGVALGRNLSVVSDINITQGALLAPDGARRFDALVLGHEEYVTQQEYDQLRLFVASGGRLVAMSSNYFYAKVTFDSLTGIEHFVIGHGYAFNGVTAWHSKVSPFNGSTRNWFGSTYCCFHRFQYAGGTVNGTSVIGGELMQYYGGTMASGYRMHEEDAVANLSHTSIVATFHNQSGMLVASNVHRYRTGAVFCLCIFGEDLVASDPSVQYFLIGSLAPGALGAPVQPASSSSWWAAPYDQAAVVVGVAILLVGAVAYLTRRRSMKGAPTRDGPERPVSRAP